MTNFIPVFPLSLIAFPGESLNLHIFEPRYKQLILECSAQSKPFGIPAVVNNEIKELGCLMEITEISKTYEDGKMDIKTRGMKVFHMLELVKEIPDKLYSGAIVTYKESFNNGSVLLMKKLVDQTRLLHKTIGVNKDFGKPDEQLNTYDLAHHVGMTIEDEYQMLEYENELHRQEFLKRHLQKMMEVLSEMEVLKKKIRMNGHFKNLEGFEF